jgi:hypothetical protein
VKTVGLLSDAVDARLTSTQFMLQSGPVVSERATEVWVMNQLTPFGQVLVLGVLGAAAVLVAFFLVTHFGQAAACALWEDCAAPTVEVIRYC